MPPKKVKAIVLKRRDAGDYDRLITFYTDDLGKIEARATSVRKIQSKLGPHLEPFFYINLMVAPGKIYWRIASARIIDPFPQIRQSTSLIKAAASCVRLADESTKLQHRDIYIFNLLKKSLSFLNNRKIKPDYLAHIFAWKMLSHLGYKPELNNCLKCKKKTDKKEHYYFSVVKGGITCLNCYRSDANLIKVEKEMLDLIKLTLNNKLEYLAKLRVPKKVEQSAFSLIKEYVVYQMEKSLQI